MENRSSFCTCTSLDCPRHPANQPQGCTPCIIKNLKAREIPNCFFDLLGSTQSPKGYRFEDFAELVLQNAQNT